MYKNADILIIDDEPVVIDSVKKILSAENYTVDTAHDSNDGLKKIEASHYQLIICDIMMPGIDGFQFLEILKEKNINTPVIMTTGYATAGQAVKSLYAGAIDFLPKPFTADELLSSAKRGIRYNAIQNKMRNHSPNSYKDSMLYVPCPATYYRFGYCCWAKTEHDGTIRTGIFDLFLQTIETIEQIIPAKRDETIIQGLSFLQIKTKDQLIHNVLAPVSGRIVERNDALLNNNNIIQKDPYFKGWIYLIIPSDIEFDMKNLIPCSSDRM